MNFQRRYFEGLVSELERSFISVLMGPRQVGKSTLMKSLQQLAASKGIETQYFNLEDPRDMAFWVGDETQLLATLEATSPLLFIDEFQYLKNATKLLKILVDRGSSKKIVVSGSSSIEMHKHLDESLAGRFRQKQIFPMMFREGGLPTPLSEYVVFGGMPGLVHELDETSKMELLNNIVQTYLLKDIKSLIREENVLAFNHLLTLLAQYQGSVVSVANLARDIRLSEPAVERHLEILKQTFVCYPLQSYSKNLGNELKKSKKYYLYDLGIRHSLLRDFSELSVRSDAGAIMESFVYLTLLPQLGPNASIYFWRTRSGVEVDFIVEINRIPRPIEVKLSFSGDKCPASLGEFLKHYPEAPDAFIITQNRQPSIQSHGRTVHILAFEDVIDLPFLRT